MQLLLLILVAKLLLIMNDIEIIPFIEFIPLTTDFTYQYYKKILANCNEYVCYLIATKFDNLDDLKKSIELHADKLKNDFDINLEEINNQYDFEKKYFEFGTKKVALLDYLKLCNLQPMNNAVTKVYRTQTESITDNFRLTNQI